MFTGLIFLNGNPLAAGEHGFVTAQINYHITSLKTAHGAPHNVAGAILELLIDQGLFRAADVLLEVLGSVLGGNAAESGGGDLFLNFITQIGFIDNLQCVKTGDLVLRIGNPIDYHQFGIGPQFPGFGIVFHADLATGSHGLLRGGLDGLLDGFLQGIP